MKQPDMEARAVAREALADGHTVTGAAAKAGVARETVQRWLKDEPDLKAARAEGQSKLEDVVLEGAKTDPRLALEILRCRSRAWQKRELVKHSGQVGVKWPTVPKGEGSDGF